MKAPCEKEVAFTFVSHPSKDPKLHWRAKLVFPPNAGAETELPIEVVDGNEDPICRAVLELAGHQIEITDGKGVLAYKDFIAGRHATALWLRVPGHAPIPGGLTFR